MRYGQGGKVWKQVGRFSREVGAAPLYEGAAKGRKVKGEGRHGGW